MSNQNEVMLSGDEVPVFDRDASFDEVWGSERGIRYAQNGHHFRHDGTYVFTDTEANGRYQDRLNQQRMQETLQVEAQNRVISDDRRIEPGEVDELLAKHPAAAKRLQGMSLKNLRKVVARANGPEIAGEDGQRLMVAWLLKYTTID